MSRRLLDGKQPVPRPGAKKGGRKPVLELDKKLIDRMEQAVRIGTPADTAAIFAGINRETLRQWVLKGNADPASIYGAFLARINKAIADWEVKDISVIDKHIMGAPATYIMEPARDENGRVMFQNNPKTGEKEPIMVVARDADDNPIVQNPAIRSDWRAAIEMLSRRKPKYWARRDALDVNVEVDAVLSFDNAKPETKEAMSFDEKIAAAIRQLEEDV